VAHTNQMLRPPPCLAHILPGGTVRERGGSGAHGNSDPAAFWGREGTGTRNLVAMAGDPAVGGT